MRAMDLRDWAVCQFSSAGRMTPVDKQNFFFYFFWFAKGGSHLARANPGRWTWLDGRGHALRRWAARRRPWFASSARSKRIQELRSYSFLPAYAARRPDDARTALASAIGAVLPHASSTSEPVRARFPFPGADSSQATRALDASNGVCAGRQPE